MPKFLGVRKIEANNRKQHLRLTCSLMVGNDVCGLSSRYNYVYYYISVERPGREVRLFYDKNKEVGAGRYQPRKTQAISCKKRITYNFLKKVGKNLQIKRIITTFAAENIKTQIYMKQMMNAWWWRNSRFKQSRGTQPFMYASSDKEGSSLSRRALFNIGKMYNT